MRRTAGLLSLILIATSTATAFAATGDLVLGFGTIKIVQEGATKDVLGSWTLIRPDNSHIILNKKALYETTHTPSGIYSLLIEKAQGTSVSVVLMKNGTMVSQGSTPSASFTLNDGDSFVITARYTYTRTGTVAVTSDPAGIPFKLVGPNGIEKEGVTPASYLDTPEGMYSVTFQPPAACAQPKSQSDQLLKDSRVGFHITLTCSALDAQRQQNYEKQLTHVTVLDGNTQVTLEDVPMESWFATYVHTVARTGIMSGYTDANGSLTGRFGPGDFVSLAQLVKVAHEVAGIDETSARADVRNTRANGTWFKQYYASAEQRSWQVFRNEREDPARSATRAEVIATILQALDIRRVWPKGELFRDVQPVTQYAASVETAAVDGIIASDEGTFRPADPINRAELAKIVTLAMETYIEDSPEFTGESY